MSAVEMKVPVIGESVTEVTLSEWFVEDGDYVELDQAICEFESDKATLEFPAEAAGVITRVAAEGDDLEIGALVATIEAAAAPEQDEQADDKEPSDDEDHSQPTAESQQDEPRQGSTSQHPSPAAAKLMRENDIDQASGTGKGGRILKQDVQEAITQRNNALTDADKIATSPAQRNDDTDAPAATPQPSINPAEREEKRERMSRMRRTIAKRLVSAKNSTAMLTTFNEVDMSNIMAMRKKYQEDFVEKYGIKLGFMSLFAKACAHVLMEMPEVNAFIDGDELIYHNYADISIAISTPTGLVVPPVHDVQNLHYAEIERKIKDLAEKARNGTLSLAEMQGGTFTITNGGVFGSLLSTPILNEPQSAILGMHGIQQRPIAVDGEVVIRPMMYLALSYDHRVIDGSSSVTFLVKVKKLLEDPIRLMLDI